MEIIKKIIFSKIFFDLENNIRVKFGKNVIDQIWDQTVNHMCRNKVSLYYENN